MDSWEDCGSLFVFIFQSIFSIPGLCSLSSSHGDFMPWCTLLAPQSHRSVPLCPASREGCGQATELDFLYSPLPSKQLTCLLLAVHYSSSLSVPNCSSFLCHSSLRRIALFSAPRLCFLKLKNPSIFPEWTLAQCPTVKGSSNTVLVSMCTLDSSHSGQSGYYSLNTPNAEHLCVCPRTLYHLSVSLTENQPSNAILF